MMLLGYKWLLYDFVVLGVAQVENLCRRYLIEMLMMTMGEL